MLGIGTPGVVLGFHSIVTPDWPSRAPMHVPAPALSALVAAAQSLGTIVPVEDLVRRYGEGKSTRGMVAITFDDAYASLVDSEFVRQEIPFGVAAVAGYLADHAVFWWDRVEDTYGLAPMEARWAFAKELGLSPVAPTFDEVRRAILVRYRGRVTPVLDAAMTRLEAAAGARTSQRPQTATELARFASQPWVTVLVHTVSHPVLPLLSDEEIETEITDAVRALRGIGVRVAPILAAPYGLYDERTVRVARAAGIATTLTLAGRTLRRHRPDVVPRFCIMRGESTWKMALRVAGVADYVQRWRGDREKPPLEELGVEIGASA